MLARHELRWLPWAPLLVAEGLFARLATARLPPALDRIGSTGGQGRAIRLVGLGDSIIAGIGVERQAEGLVGQVAARVAERSGRPVEWHAVGFSGATSALVLDKLLPEAIRAEPELVVLSIGVNDAVGGVPPAEFKQRIRAIVGHLTSTPRRPSVVFGGLPPLQSFPALPWPLSRLLGERAAALQRAAVELSGYRGMKVVVFPSQLAREAFARDGFHPGPAGCEAWSRWVTDGFALRVGQIAERSAG